MDYAERWKIRHMELWCEIGVHTGKNCRDTVKASLCTWWKEVEVDVLSSGQMRLGCKRWSTRWAVCMQEFHTDSIIWCGLREGTCVIIVETCTAQMVAQSTYAVAPSGSRLIDDAEDGWHGGWFWFWWKQFARWVQVMRIWWGWWKRFAEVKIVNRSPMKINLCSQMIEMTWRQKLIELLNSQWTVARRWLIA